MAPNRSLDEDNGAPRRNRTADPIITNDVLYQLSYRGTARVLGERAQPRKRPSGRVSRGRAMTRKASCCCGACTIEVEGEPVLNALCHCANCRRRTGSAFGWSAYFADEAVTTQTGEFGLYEIKSANPQPLLDRGVTVTDMSVVAYLIVHPRGTLLWDTGTMPDELVKPEGTTILRATARVARLASPRSSSRAIRARSISSLTRSTSTTKATW